MTPPILYDTNTVSKMLGLHPNTIYFLVAREKLEAYRVGNGFKFSDAQVAAYLEKCRTKRRNRR